MRKLLLAGLCPVLWSAVGCNEDLARQNAAAEGGVPFAMSPLGQAAYKGDVEQVKALLAQGADPGVQGAEDTPSAAGSVGRALFGGSYSTRFQESAFYGAVMAQHWDIVKLMAAKCGEMYVPGKNCAGALEMAIRVGDEAAVRGLLNRGADANVSGPIVQLPPLSQAASMGEFEIEEALLKKGASVNAFDKEGFTALAQAAQIGYRSSVNLLLKNGADVNLKGEAQPGTGKAHTGLTALAAAGYAKNADLAKLLLEKGADMAAARASLESYRQYWVSLNSDAMSGLCKDADAFLAGLGAKN